MFAIDENLVNVLSGCKKAVAVSIPTRRDDGSVTVFEGFRVTHNIARGPSKGGIRYHPDVTLDEVALARDVDDVEVRADGIPFGGAKGGVVVDPKSLSRLELERMTRRYTSEIINEIGPEKDIPAPDVGTNAQVMAWIFDTYSMNKGHSVLGVVTGKPLEIGGSLGREEATARGGLYALRGALRKSSLREQGMRSRSRASGTSACTSRGSSSTPGARVVRSPTRPAACTRRTGSTSRGHRAQAGDRHARRLPRRRADLERGLSPSTATCSRRARSSR